MKDTPADLGGSLDKITNSEEDQSWIAKIFNKRVCTTFVEDTLSNGARCQCGEVRDAHCSVALRDYFTAAVMNCWSSAQHSSEYPTDAFGEVQFVGTSRRHSKFLRLSWDTQPSMVYSLMTTQWRLPIPNLVVSIVGGEGRTKVKTWVRELIRQGLVKASQRAGAWILTTGLRDDIGRCVGEAVRDHSAAASSNSLNRVVAVAIAPWGVVHNKEQLVNPQGSFPAKYHIQNPDQGYSCLDNNYQAFLLVDDGSVGRRGGEAAFRIKLEGYISHQRTGIRGNGLIEIPILCMLISGDASMLERVDLSLKNSAPLLVLAGSGGLADFLTDLLQNVSSAPGSPLFKEADDEASTSLDVKEKVAERVKRYFSKELEKDKVVEQVLRICQHRDLITIYHGEQESPADFDTILLKALVRTSKRSTSVDVNPCSKELKLAVAWNRVDIAKSELFNGDIQWRDLEESMMDVLVNDKPQFVRLFIENGLNILDFLTYGRLEQLYCSIADSTLLFQLLQRQLVLRLATTKTVPATATILDVSSALTEEIQSRPITEITLFEASGALDLIMGDVCQPFYYDVMGLEKNTSQWQALRRASKLMSEDCSYQEKRCLYPWASLFIWAVLQNRREMATFFWEMAGESVLTALGGCKILRELSKLEMETEIRISMKELAQTFENLAHDVYRSCYQDDESRSFDLLIRKSPVWGGTTCLQLAMSANARLFFSHDGVQVCNS